MFKFLGKRNTAAIAALVVAAVAGVGAYAFTASNTVPAHSAGAGIAVVSGYTVSNIGYTWSPDGLTVESVSFDLSGAAADVKVALTATGTPVQADWQDCGASGGSSPYLVTCTFGTPIANADAVDLSVAADSSGSVTIAAS